MKDIQLQFLTDETKRKYLSPRIPSEGLDEKLLKVEIIDGDTRRVYPVFQQKAGTYGTYSEYMTRHGCACCSLTTVLAAFLDKYAALRPERTIENVERQYFSAEIVQKNYGKTMARQMPVSLYGISIILRREGISCSYIGNFEDEVALRQIREHLYQGKPVIIETSRIRRRGKWIASFSDRKYAGSYHTMILLGMDEEGQVVFTDSATRAWAGQQQRLKRAKLSELMMYMFPQKNIRDTHVYFSRRRNTGGYILLG